MAQATMYFPAGFRWGTATSSYQVEGSNQNSDWWQFEQRPGAILEGGRSGIACDWWENFEEDLDRAAEMGTNAHRLSLEWSRIEPEPSLFDDEALGRYREILQSMRDRGIEPMVTLHHFSNPLWLVEKGDFDTDLAVEYFRRYTTKVVQSLGDLIPLWVTINEPMIYAYKRYIAGKFPPAAHKGWGAAGRALVNLLRCHAVAYHTIKEALPGALAGVAHNFMVFDPLPGWNPLRPWWNGQLSWLMNEWWMEAMTSGKPRWPLGRGHGQINGLAGSFDFTGVNYYTRFFTRFLRGESRQWPAGSEISDGDYGEVYPAGMFRVIKHAMRYERPIYITENGLPDRGDRLRSAFILTHLREVWRAVNFNWPVRGYYHRSLVDSFEWERGWTQRFGLIALDPESGERRLRRSGELYGEICRTGSISSDMAAHYAPQTLPKLFPGQTPAAVAS